MRLGPLAVIGALGLLAAGEARAQVYFPRDGTIDFLILSEAVVGKDFLGHDSSPTVSVADGANINRLAAYNASTVNMSGGLAFGMGALDLTRITVSGGEVRNGLGAEDQATVTVTGGTVGGLNLRENGSGTVVGGRVNQISAGGNSRAVVQGGNIGEHLIAGGSSDITLSAGVVGGLAEALDHDVLNINGGEVQQGVVTRGLTTTNMGGGLVRVSVIADSQSVFTMSGGSVLGHVDVFDTGHARIGGGFITGGLHTYNSGSFTLGSCNLVSVNSPLERRRVSPAPWSSTCGSFPIPR